MKGQLVFEYVIAGFILFAIVIYAINFLSNSMTTYHSRYLNNFLESKALQISEVLLKDPENGIIGEWPALDAAKMDEFNRTCYSEDGYLLMLARFGLFESEPYDIYRHMNILVKTDSEEYIRCGRTPPEMVTNALVTRYGLLPPGDIAAVYVTVW